MQDALSASPAAGSQAGPAHARCPKHPEARATDTCERCGSYACGRCSSEIRGRGLICEDCSPAALADLRSLHIQHETSVRSVGLVYVIAGAVAVVSALAVLIAGIAAEGDASLPLAGIGIAYGALGAGVLSVGIGVRRLRAWARVPAIILASLGLLGFPLGTLINGYMLYLLLSASGQVVFTPVYAEAVAATPHIKAKTSIVVWIVLALLVLVLIAVGLSALPST